MNLRKDHSKSKLVNYPGVLAGKGVVCTSIYAPILQPYFSFHGGAVCPSNQRFLFLFYYVKDHDGGYIGFWNDEERSETRYLMRIAEFSESSSFRTQLAIIGYSFDCAFLTCTLNNNWCPQPVFTVLDEQVEFSPLVLERFA